MLKLFCHGIDRWGIMGGIFKTKFHWSLVAGRLTTPERHFAWRQAIFGPRRAQKLTLSKGMRQRGIIET
jgi:hypothetical protein